ncbi:MAG: ATP-binding protein [Vagococcus sp.]|jgi:DNA replication protein DnaC|nr:ATP-binding protein [Vagococcus sp.]
MKMKNPFNFDMDEFTYVTDHICPQCGGEMRAWIIKEGMEPRGSQVCMNLEIIDGKERWGGCGYRMQLKKEAENVAKKLSQSLEQKAYGYLAKNSIVANDKTLKRLLDGFIANEKETQQALTLSRYMAKEIAQGKTVHALYLGKTGTGKTHLAIGVAREMMKQSKFSKNAMFISYPEYYSLVQSMYQVQEAARTVELEIMYEIKKADLVILDDLGAEIGGIGESRKPTDNNIKMLTRILDAREEKNLIITSNLSGKDIINLYGERAMSRIRSNLKTSNGNERIIQLKDSADYRAN